MNEQDIPLSKEIQRMLGIDASSVPSEEYINLMILKRFEMYKKIFDSEVPHLVNNEIKGKVALIDFELLEIIKDLRKKVSNAYL